MLDMFVSDNYKIVANPEQRVYQLINLKSFIVEAEDIVYPKLLIALREYERQIGLAEQTKEKENAVVPFPVR